MNDILEFHVFIIKILSGGANLWHYWSWEAPLHTIPSGSKPIFTNLYDLHVQKDDQKIIILGMGKASYCSGEISFLLFLLFKNQCELKLLNIYLWFRNLIIKAKQGTEICNELRNNIYAYLTNNLRYTFL